MNIAVLGTGTVARTLAGSLAAQGHDVRMGTREVATALARTDPGPWGAPPLAAWLRDHTLVRLANFADAAAFGEVLVNCTAGMHSLEALQRAGAENLAGKVVIDVANPLDFSKGMPPRLAIADGDSLAETLQRAFPEARVVKALNTVTASLMVDPASLPGDHDVFVAGNDPEARAAVAGWLKEWFGWKAPIDLGDLVAARALEGWLPLWIRLMGTLGTVNFNLHVVR